MSPAIRRFIAFVIANLLVSAFSYGVYSYCYAFGGLGYIFPYTVSLALIMMSIYFVDNPPYKAFENLTYSTIIMACCSACFLGNTFFYNADNFVCMAKSQADTVSVADFNIELDRTKFELNLAASACTIGNFKKSPSMAYTIVPLVEKNKNEINFVYLHYQQLKKQDKKYTDCSNMDVSENQERIASITKGFSRSRYFKIANNKKLSMYPKENEILEKLAIAGIITDNNYFILEAAGFDLLWWRDFWRKALVVVVVIYTLLLLYLLSKLIK